MSYFNYATGATMTNRRFHALFGGPPRKSEENISQREMDLARSIQVVTEEIVLKIVRHLHSQCDSKNLCLAGGVALNCVANGRILREGPFENIWIQPAAGDAGGALGAALVAWHHYYGGSRNVSPHHQDNMQGAYLGPGFSDDDIRSHLEKASVPYSELEENSLHKSVAQLIDDGKVIGWFQGRMEFGPRALGNRSIIGDPRNTDMQSTMNLKIKQRESFRPFAPAVLEEDVQEYFQIDRPSPYMLLVADVQKSLQREVDNSLEGIEKLKQTRSDLPAITHVDYSARVQTVNAETNPDFYHLLKAFKERSGCGVLINTSFNVRGEPPVCSPEDAVRCFLATDMDYLVLGNIVLDKREQSAEAIDKAKTVTFELD